MQGESVEPAGDPTPALFFELLRDLPDLEGSSAFCGFWWDRYEQLKAEDTEATERLNHALTEFLYRDRRLD